MSKEEVLESLGAFVTHSCTLFFLLVWSPIFARAYYSIIYSLSRSFSRQLDHQQEPYYFKDR